MTGMTYRDAGVDIEAGDALVERIKPAARATLRPGVMGGLGGFGALFDPRAAGFTDPILVATTDGVGTKLRIAIEAGRHGGVGQDLVAMCVNDLVVQGAAPLFFLDYYATGALDVAAAAAVIDGIATGCRLAECALVGGETAEMPGMYHGEDYDLAGFCVGVVEKDAIIDGRHTRPGDAVIGLSASGPHSNGYSLIRKLLATSGADAHTMLEDRPLLERLLAPTRIYVKPLLALARAVPLRAMAHITGGGLTDNIPRVLPEGLEAVLKRRNWPHDPVFDWLQRTGRIEAAEMYRTFNCGIGMVVVVPAGHETAALEFLAAQGERAQLIGEIRSGTRGVVIE